MKDLNEKEALNKAAAYCSAAEHCKSLRVPMFVTNSGLPDGDVRSLQ